MKRFFNAIQGIIDSIIGIMVRGWVWVAYIFLGYVSIIIIIESCKGLANVINK